MKLQLAVALVGLCGCASTSIQRDVRDVAALTHVVLPSVAQDDVRAESVDDTRKILNQPLDAEGAVRIALLNNRELRARLRGLGISRGALVQAGILPNPTVEAELLPERNTTLELRVEYDLTSLLMAPLRAGAARVELDAARYQVAGDTLTLGYRVRAAFYTAQAAERRLHVGHQMLDSLAAARDAAQALRKAGSTSERELVAQEAALERARVSNAKLELMVVKAREALTRLMGVHGAETQWALRGALAEPERELVIPEHFENRCVSASLELTASKLKLEALAKRAGVTRTEGLVPDVAADVHVLAGDPTAQQSADKSWRVGGGLRVGLPIFDRKQGRTLSLESEFDAELERFYGKATDIRSAARELRAEVTSAHARARQFQTVIVPAQKKFTAETLLQYNAMQLGIFQLLEAKREELDADLQYVDTLREYWIARAAVESLMAGQRVTPPKPGDAAPFASPAEVGVH